MSWIKKLAFRLDGKSTYFGQNVKDPRGVIDRNTPINVYRSIDFPHVFLGGADIDDISDVEQMAGAKICARIDVTDAEVSRMLPPHTIKTPLPEHRQWDEQKYNAAQEQFNQTADQLCQIITANHCPIYVHCSAGVNRSVSILSAALSKLTNRPLNDILTEMRTQRFHISPHDAYYLMALEYSPADDTHKQQVRQEMDKDYDTIAPSYNQTQTWEGINAPIPLQS